MSRSIGFYSTSFFNLMCVFKVSLQSDCRFVPPVATYDSFPLSLYSSMGVNALPVFLFFFPLTPLKDRTENFSNNFHLAWCDDHFCTYFSEPSGFSLLVKTCISGQCMFRSCLLTNSLWDFKHFLHSYRMWIFYNQTLKIAYGLSRSTAF